MNEQSDLGPSVTVNIRSSSTNPKNPPGVEVRATDLANKERVALAVEAAWMAWLAVHDHLEEDAAEAIRQSWMLGIEKEQRHPPTDIPGIPKDYR